MENPKEIIAIAGAPRSGTSWLAQIIDSSPNVRHRFQPIFSYAFKNAVNQHSTKEDFSEDFSEPDHQFQQSNH